MQHFLLYVHVYLHCIYICVYACICTYVCIPICILRCLNTCIHMYSPLHMYMMTPLCERCDERPYRRIIGPNVCTLDMSKPAHQTYSACTTYIYMYVPYNQISICLSIHKCTYIYVERVGIYIRMLFIWLSTYT